MKFSERSYKRPDYSKVKDKISECKNKMQQAVSYQMFRDSWLDIKKEIEYMVFQEEIIYIRYLCGIDYPYSLEEVEIQDREEPPVYALRNECDRMAAASGYRNELEQEFGRQIFAHIAQHRAVGNPDSIRLQSEESALKTQYRKLMAKDSRDEVALYQVVRKLIEIRCELADSLGYKSYIELGYHIEGRQNYGTGEVADFRCHIQKYVTPAVAGIKVKEIDFCHPPAIPANSRELISAVSTMFQDLSYEAGSYAVNEIHAKAMEHFMFPYLNLFIGKVYTEPSDAAA